MPTNPTYALAQQIADVCQEDLTFAPAKGRILKLAKAILASQQYGPDDIAFAPKWFATSWFARKEPNAILTVGILQTNLARIHAARVAAVIAPVVPRDVAPSASLADWEEDQRLSSQRERIVKSHD
jgi:hypothetical protein